MNKIRTWFNRAKKKQEVENQLVIRPLTSERRHQASHDVPVVMEMLSSTQRDLDGRLIQSDLIQTTRLSMLRELLQGDTSQEQEVSDFQRQHYRTTTSAPLPVWRSALQVEQEEEAEQVTGDEMQTEPTSDRRSDVISLAPSEYPGLPARLFLKMRDSCSAPSSPHPGGRRRLPCSLPCSPLLGGRRWRSSDSAPSLPSPLSRLCVEAALQRSRNIRPPPPPSPQVRQEGQVAGGRCESGETEEESEEEEEEEEDKDNQVLPAMSTVIFRPMTSPSTCERYCLLTPCVCSRCPSAPPYEGQVFSAGNSRTDPSLRSEDQTQLRTDTQRTDTQRTDTQRMDTQRTDTQRTDTQRMDTQRTDTQRTDTQRTEVQSLTADRAPQQGESSRLYPSLSQWRITADAQTELDRKQEVNGFSCQLDTNTVQSCFHGNTDDHLQRVCETTSGSPGDVSFCSDDLNFILRKVFDSTTCSRTTVRHVESCSFCSDTLSDRVTKHLCNNCDQVFCGRCLSHFVSLLQIHQFSQTAAV